MKTAVPTYLLALAILILPRAGAAVGGSLVTHTDRVRATLIPEVRFDEATFEQAVAFLAEEADVNIVIDPAVYASSSRTRTSVPPARQEQQPSPAAVQEPGVAGTRPPDDSTRITLRLKNVPLEVVLKYILRYKNLRYIVEDYAIVIVPIGRTLPEEMKTEIFRLRTGSPPRIRHLRPQAVRSF